MSRITLSVGLFLGLADPSEGLALHCWWSCRFEPIWNKICPILLQIGSENPNCLFLHSACSVLQMVKKVLPFPVSAPVSCVSDIQVQKIPRHRRCLFTLWTMSPFLNDVMAAELPLSPLMLLWSFLWGNTRLFPDNSTWWVLLTQPALLLFIKVDHTQSLSLPHSLCTHLFNLLDIIYFHISYFYIAIINIPPFLFVFIITFSISHSMHCSAPFYSFILLFYFYLTIFYVFPCYLYM